MPDQPTQVLPDLRPQVGHHRRRFGEAPGNSALRGCGRKGRVPGQHLEQHAPQAVQIAPAVQRSVGQRLLRAHVGWRADGKPGVGQATVIECAHRLGDSEVGHDRVAAFQQDVLRLDVPVDHPSRMGVTQRIGDFARDLDRIGDRERPLAAELVAQRFPLDQRHDIEQEPAGFARVIEGEDVGMAEFGGGFDFAEESLRAECRRQFGPEHFDRHPAPMFEVFREVHRGHPARTEFALDPVAVG